MVPRLRSRASARSRSSPRSLPRSTPGPWSRASAAAGRDSDRKASRLESQRARRPGPSAPRAPGTRHAARASGTRHGTPGRARTLTRAPAAPSCWQCADPRPHSAAPGRSRNARKASPSVSANGTHIAAIYFRRRARPPRRDEAPEPRGSPATRPADRAVARYAGRAGEATRGAG